MASAGLFINALATISVASAFLYLFMLSDHSLRRSIVKTTAVGTLACIAWLVEAHVIALALALSAIGDFALSREGTRAFLCGMIAFALAHIIYMILFLIHADGAHNQTIFRIGFSLILLFVAIKLGRAYSAKAGDLASVVLIYVTIITLMALSALWSDWGWPFCFAVSGVMFFVTSDTVIGQQMFLKKHWHGQSFTIWVTYYLAQVLLLVGFGFFELSHQFL